MGSDLPSRLERELLPPVEHGPSAGLVRQAISALQGKPQASQGGHDQLPITDYLVSQLQERAQRGLSKYGTTLDRDDLTTPEWLLHAIEERLDDVGYMEAARRRALKDQARIAELEAEVASLRAVIASSCPAPDARFECRGCGVLIAASAPMRCPKCSAEAEALDSVEPTQGVER